MGSYLTAVGLHQPVKSPDPYTSIRMSEENAFVFETLVEDMSNASGEIRNKNGMYILLIAFFLTLHTCFDDHLI
jgi:hypothetical protein